jgi:hypothetical protein
MITTHQLSRLVQTLHSLFGTLGPALVARFKEREETVRLEVLASGSYAA